MNHRFESILDTVGRTPAVRLARLAPDGVNVYVKIESFNPMGSVKDRLALGIIEAAERSGELKPGQTETFDAYKAGSLQALLKLHEVVFDESLQLDPYSLFPGWLQKR